MLYNLEQSAEFLNISTTSVKRLIEGGSLVPTPYGKQDTRRPAIRFSPVDLREFKKRMTADPSLLARAGVKTENVPEGHISMREAATRLGWPYQRIADQVKRDKVKAITVGNRRFISSAEMDRLVHLPKSGRFRDTNVPPATNGTPTTLSAAPALMALTAKMTKHIDEINAKLQKLDVVEKQLTDIQSRITALVAAFT